VEQINSRRTTGKFFFTQLAAVAELEREQIQARTGAAMPIKASATSECEGHA